ncbi:MAG: bifunctional homocysteine S-methyltransferase/methylenetetrahydrofolate reductase [Acutalibacteraceae bacterium]
MKIKDLQKTNQPLIADGAMGTYFSNITGESAELCETYNIIHPKLIEEIHTSYIQAGAKLLRTNTFSANTKTLNLPLSQVLDIIRMGYQAATHAAADKAVICADVSVIYTNDDEEFDPTYEYHAMIDTWLECGAETFIFETLPDMELIIEPIQYIRSNKPNAEIIVSFTILPDGRTRSGLPLNTILSQIKEHENELTAVGLNCGCGTAQLYNYAKQFIAYISHNTNLMTTIMPNAGYPSIEQTRTVFTSTPNYFASETARLAALGFDIVGGCCGTDPTYIRTLSQHLKHKKIVPNIPEKSILPKSHQQAFSSKLTKQDFVVAAELDPPYGSDLTKLMNAAAMLKESGVDIITISDSPLAHVKMEPVLCSTKIAREVGIDTLPHLCCRDRNINALRSVLLGAHSEGIRSVLVVTGDPIAETDRGVVKPVFNFSSTQFMKMISQMNEDVFADEPIAIGGAFNPNPAKAEFALNRLKKKMESGASFFLTQAVFSDDVIPVLEKARSYGAKILVGILPMVTYRNACFLCNEVPGMSISHELIERFSPDMSREDAENVGIEIAYELAKKLKPHSDGFYFMTPFNRASVICRIIEKLKKDLLL